MVAPTDIAREVIAAEAAALHALAEMIGRDLSPILETLRAAQQIIVSGLGKSGIVAEKIAATLTSTGSPAVFMHPVEALHGDLGIVTDRHCLIALSRSGNTDELLRFVEHFRRLGGPVIALTQGHGSRLAELAKHTVLLPDLPEAGPLALAPTTSTIMQLAAGDAIAMALLHSRGFAAEDFAQYHPEGSLGKRLLLRARDLMHSGEQLPLVRIHETFDQLLLTMTRKQLGLALVIDPAGHLVGTFTDGDLRRILERVDDPRQLDAAAAHSRSRRDPGQPAVPVSTVEPEHLAVDCLRIMRDSQITSLVVADAAGRPVGLLRLLDLLRAGLS